MAVINVPAIRFEQHAPEKIRKISLKEEPYGSRRRSNYKW
jgi:hypothetical protein